MRRYAIGSLTLLFAFGCSSSSGARRPTGAEGGTPTSQLDGGGSGGTVGTGSAPTSNGGSSGLSDDGSCGPALAPLPTGNMTGADGLAVVGTDVFVATTDSSSGHRLISVVKDGALSQVADVPSDKETIEFERSGFYVDADAFYVDTVRGDDRPLYRVDRKSGAQTMLAKIKADEGRFHPLFLADAQYLYYAAMDGNATLTRILKSGISAPEPLQDGVFDNLGGLDSAMTLDGTNVYYVSNDSSGGGTAKFNLAFGLKAPTSALDRYAKQRKLTAPLCAYDPWYLQLDTSGNAYVSCRNAAQDQQWIYSYAPGDADSTTEGHVVVTKPGMTGRVFAVANGNVYFEAADGNRNRVFRVPVAGGTATAILKAEAVDHMFVSGSNLYVTSGCGVQMVPL